MVRRLFLAVAVLVIVCGRQAVKAEPITYKFSGTLLLTTPPTDSDQGWGPTFFNGSFTVDSDSAATNQIPFTVNVLGRTLGPTSYAMFDQYASPDGPMTQLALEAGANGYGFSMLFTNPGEINQFKNLTNFNFSKIDVNSLVFDYVDKAGANNVAYGTLTSIEAISTPEPNSLIVFAMLGTAAWAYRRRCSSKEPAMEVH